MSVTNYPASIPTFIGTVVDEVRTAILADLQAYDPTIQTISYLYGNIKEVTERLQEMHQSMTSGAKTNPYPVFILLEDIIINRSNTGGFYGTPTMNVIIANHTKQEYKSDQRESINFAPILRPMYYKFLERLSVNRYTVIKSVTSINHNMTERKYWGVDENTKNALGSFVDAIDITNLTFPINWTYCSNPITNII